jgi:hypothetical protein
MAASYHGVPGEQENVLWIDPGDPSTFDFQYGIGGKERQPQPPFRFVDEDMEGTSPKVNVTDAHGETWNVKWGPEVSSSTFCTRLVWACGYIVEPEYFVRKGRIENTHGLRRAGAYISRDGSFVNARFQLRSNVPRFLDGKSWAWTNNPFLTTHPFQGLKILMLLVSNWDTKDARDMPRASKNHGSVNTNLAIFEDDNNGNPRYLYANDDWGASMGQWGNIFTWTKWDCKGFASQNEDFIRSSEDRTLRWGFKGKHAQDMTGNISVEDVQWLLQYLDRITDEQIRIGLTASGATPKETDCYAGALRQRIETLKKVAGENH